ncbi:MAG: vWA domain-containing protein [Pirellulaceae bacterium]
MSVHFVLSLALAASALAAAAAPVLANQHVVVVLDDSGSMDESMRSMRGTRKIDAAKSALATVVNQLDDDAQIGIIVLNGAGDGQRWVVPLGPLDQNNVRRAVAGIQASGGTPLGQVLKEGADALLQVRDKEHYGNYRLLVVTDGEASDPGFLDAILPDVLGRGITIDVIGVDMAQNHSLATRVHSYRRADDPASLTAAISAVFGETSSDSDETGQSDFDMLSGIPTEVASAALEALAESGNDPIEPQDTAYRSDGAYHYPQRQPGSSSETLGFLCLGSLCLLVVLGLVAILSAVLVIFRRGR